MIFLNRSRLLFFEYLNTLDLLAMHDAILLRLYNDYATCILFLHIIDLIRPFLSVYFYFGTACPTEKSLTPPLWKWSICSNHQESVSRIPFILMAMPISILSTSDNTPAIASESLIHLTRRFGVSK